MWRGTQTALTATSGNSQYYRQCSGYLSHVRRDAAFRPCLKNREYIRGEDPKIVMALVRAFQIRCWGHDSQQSRAPFHNGSGPLLDSLLEVKPEERLP